MVPRVLDVHSLLFWDLDRFGLPFDFQEGARDVLFDLLCGSDELVVLDESQFFLELRRPQPLALLGCLIPQGFSKIHQHFGFVTGTGVPHNQNVCFISSSAVH